jgi:hypothetical protein
VWSLAFLSSILFLFFCYLEPILLSHVAQSLARNGTTQPASPYSPGGVRGCSVRPPIGGIVYIFR